MPFQWDVQPYEKLSELRDFYLQFFVVTSYNGAKELAVEAEAWMKENAPWQDRGEFVINQDGSVRQIRTDWERQVGHAREGLEVYVVGGEQEDREVQQMMKKMRQEDAAKLADINKRNRERYLAAGTGIQKAIKSGKLGSIQDLPFAARMEYYRLGKKKTKLPKSQSSVAQYQRFLAQKFPLVDVHFRNRFAKKLRYVIWLELANNGRYSIIGPAMDYWLPKVMAKVKRIANLKQYQSLDLRSYLEDIQSQEYQQAEFEKVATNPNLHEKGYYKPHSPEVQAESARRRPQYRKIRTNRRKYQHS